MPAQGLEDPHLVDIRDRPSLAHADILRLNFIRGPCPYVFRRHYRAGLRSHLMEVLRPEDLAVERNGGMVGGLKVFPRAVPIKMLRIFRRRFTVLDQPREEIARVETLEAFLGPEHIARSTEFLVDYKGPGKREILLAGLQEYVLGEVLEPWNDVGESHLRLLLARMEAHIPRAGAGATIQERLHRLKKTAASFTERIRRMIVRVGLVPDLAGVGNLLMTPEGGIKLVDINNISRVSPGPTIPLDDQGYPVCDKSIAVLFHIEKRLAGTSPSRNEPFYAPFLNADRIAKVREAEERFHLSRVTSPPQ